MKGKIILAILVFVLAGGLGIFAQTQHSITVQWGASPTSGVAYNVYRGTTSTGPFTKVGSDVTALKYIDTSGTGGTTYYYQITAICDTTTTCPTGIVGESDPTPPSVGVTFLASPAAPPAAPSVSAQ